MPRTSSGRSHHGRARDRADPPFGGILPDSAGPRRRTGGRCWEWLPLAAALCTALAVSFASHRLADGVRAMEGAGRWLAAVRADAYRLNALEWQAVTAGAVDPSLDLELNTTLQRVRGLLEAGGSQAEPLAPAVRRAFGAYEEVVGQEWRLLAAGRPSEASALQRERSGPDFRALVEAVDEEIAGAAERAGAADLKADLGLTSALVVSALVVGAGFRRLLRARRSRAADEEMFLRKSEARFRSLVENSSDVITVVGADATILDQSTAVEAVFGYPSGQLIGTRFTDLVHPSDLPAVATAFSDIVNGHGRGRIEARLRHRDGSWRHTETTVTDLLSDPSVSGIVLNTRDVSDQKSLERELRHQAFHDPLTSLANRSLFADRVGHAIAQRERRRNPLAVLMLDLDDFKTVNDSLGHTAGDELLVGVAARLGSHLREADTLARLGGDEFAVLLEDIDGPAGAVDVARRVLQALQAPMEIEGHEVAVHASIGIAIASTRAENAGELLRNADTALYVAKRSGKDRYEIFEPRMHQAVLDRLQLAADLRQAVEGRQVFVHYQPIVELHAGKIVGAEALARWRHRDRGLVHPAEFIPVAEETGLIVPLGRMVLEYACYEARSWPREPGEVPLRVSVNLSAKQLQDPEFVGDVSRILLESGLDPGSLILEITESVMMDDAEGIGRKLAELRALGVRLAVDDFGTGYSSLSYLQRFPIDILKIDKSFIDGVGGGAEESALAHAIVKLGHAMSLQSLAEGIEGSGQVSELRALGCDLAQGYHFGRPMAGDALRVLLDPPRNRAGHAARIVTALR